jgi:hypothetical protein
MTRPAGVMVGGAVGTWLVAVAATGPALMADLLFGMLAPLLVAVVTWELAQRTYRRNPEQLTALMVTAFAAKMVFYGGYVAAMLLGLRLHPIPFTLSFTAYFIGLNLVEALSLRRLFAEGAHGTR